MSCYSDAKAMDDEAFKLIQQADKTDDPAEKARLMREAEIYAWDAHMCRKCVD